MRSEQFKLASAWEAAICVARTLLVPMEVIYRDVLLLVQVVVCGGCGCPHLYMFLCRRLGQFSSP